MTDVVIAGIGQTEVGEHWDLSLRELAVTAMEAAIKDAGGLQPQSLFVGNMLAPNLSNQAHLGALLADFGGLHVDGALHGPGIEAITVEAAGASGGAALRQAYVAVASGWVDVALVVGVEKLTDKIGPGVEEAMSTVSDSDFEAVQGLTSSAQAALIARRYFHEFDVPADGLAGFALTAHANGAGNKYAMFQKAIKPEAYAKAEASSDPLNMFDIAPLADGAAAVVLTRRDMLPSNYSHPLVKIAASAAASDTLALHDRRDPLAFTAVKISTELALRKSAVPLERINFFEYHDAFGIFAALSLEAAGFAPRGGGWQLAADGSISLRGRIPCATMGGLKARGFAGGATGLYQAVEATLQLRGCAGPNQLAAANVGLIQSLGGPAATAITHILQKMD